TALSSNDGEFVTSTTTSAPARAPASPSPVRVLTPEEGEADTASCPRPRSRGMSFFPISPLPPITTIFMSHLLVVCTNQSHYSTPATDQRDSSVTPSSSPG